MEQIVNIKGFDGKYKISNKGIVYSYMKGKDGYRLKEEKTTRGYLRVHLNRKHYSIHRLVANHFIKCDIVDENIVINHKDGNKENNHVDNLEWVTQKQNIQHSFKNGMSKARKGIENKLSNKILKIDIHSNEVVEEIVGLRNYCNNKKYDRRCIQRAINGEYKTAYGFKWVLT